MKQYLEMNWDLGIAMGELSSSFLLVLLILIVRATIKNKTLVPLLFGISVLASILIGFSIGSAVSGNGHGWSLMSPVFALLMSFHYQAFSALGFIIAFEFLGTLLGAGVYLLYKYFLIGKSSLQKSESSITYKQTSIKSLLFQPLLLIVILYIPTLDATTYDTGIVLNTLMLCIVLTLIFYLTSKFNFVMLSPFVGLVVALEDGIKNKNIKEQLINFSIEVAIQAIAMTLILSMDIYAFHHKNY